MIDTRAPQNEPLSSALRDLDEDRLAWLALAMSPSLGPRRILEAMRSMRPASRLFALSLTELESLRFPAEAAQFIFDGKARRAAEEEWRRVSAEGAAIFTFQCPEYP